mmetsp:Transcript_19951/g.57966  ORF Transcript_19951/g.57966 Transcript_19951/m.57966 type:complete len:298 (-) Transcript_19951:80-973(-)
MRPRPLPGTRAVGRARGRTQSSGWPRAPARSHGGNRRVVGAVEPLGLVGLRRRTPVGLVEEVLHLGEVLDRPRRIWRRRARWFVPQLQGHGLRRRVAAREGEGGRSLLATRVARALSLPGSTARAAALPPRVHVHVPRQAPRARALGVVPRRKVRDLRRAPPSAHQRAALPIAAVMSRRADTAAPVPQGCHAASAAAALAAAATLAAAAWCRSNADLETVDEHLPGLQRRIGAIGGILCREADVDEVLTWDARVRRLVAMDHLAELRHGPADANTTVLGHDACGDPHESRHGAERWT